jgi:LPXTG-motif cell wall-anchored protein
MVPVKFKGVLISETKIVAFETMKNDKGLVVATHNDIEDKDQTTYVPSIRTKASVGGLPVAFAGIDTILRDEVTYKNLVPGISYRVEGVLMQKSTGKQLVLGNEAVVASTTFKPETADGSVVVEFPKFDASTLANDGVVVFEKLYVIVTDEETHEDVEVEIANHEDLTDTDQTVVFPKVGTTAAQIQKGKNIEVTDVVKYEGLQVGYEYTVRGILVDTNGEPVIVGGKTIAAETTFTAKEADGTITVSLPEFDPFYMYGGDQSRARDYKYVVFEEVYVHATNEEGQDMIALVGEHKDLTDEGQTVFGHEEPKTGDDTPIWPLAVGFAVCIAGVGFLFIFRRRRKNQK